jgi:hypothetical protein
VRYSLTPSNGGTSLRVDDDVRFKGRGKLAVAIATRDINHRWHSSLEKLKATVEGGNSRGLVDRAATPRRTASGRLCR